MASCKQQTRTPNINDAITIAAEDSQLVRRISTKQEDEPDLEHHKTAKNVEVREMLRNNSYFSTYLKFYKSYQSTGKVK